MRKSDYLTSFDLLAKYLLIIEQGFKGVLATRFGSLETENYHRVPRIRENQVPTGPYWVPNIFLKKPAWSFVLTLCTLTWITEILVRAMSNVHAGRMFPAPALNVLSSLF